MDEVVGAEGSSEKNQLLLLTCLLYTSMEVLIPLEMAKIIDVGIANGDMSYIIQRGVILVAMAMLSLFFGVQEMCIRDRCNDSCI